MIPVFLILAFVPVIVDMRTRKADSLLRASLWTGIYVATALTFAGYLYYSYGHQYANLFLSAYMIEKAMSVDNLMIFGAVFTYFGVRAEHQHRVLQWGIVGSAVLRMVFIALGLTVFFVFGRLMDVLFGAFVVWTGVKVLQSDTGEVAINHAGRWYIRWTRYFFPSTPEMNGQFVVRKPFLIGSYLAATPLLFCLIAMEFTDLAFAFDSMPAVVGLTRSPLLAYTSTMFAVIGLRSMYFVLDGLRRYTSALGSAVTSILVFVGGGMIFRGLFNTPMAPDFTVAVIVVLLLWGVLRSLYQKRLGVA